MKNLSLTLFLSIIFSSLVFGQNVESEPKYKHSIGSNLFMFGNFSKDSPEYATLTYGYRLTSEDRIYAEFITWIYPEPQGSYGDSEELFPGYVRTLGIGLGYQRFFWKGLFASASATPFLTQYYDEDDNKIQNGFQLYTQVFAGYRFQFFNKRLYIEPAYGIKNWPIDTNLPDEFEVIEKEAQKYKIEPSLNIGFRF